MKTNKKLIGTGLLTAIAASLCCVTPILALIAGASGLASTLSWFTPFRQYFVGLTFLALGFAWYQKLKPQKEISCNSEMSGKPGFIQTKTFLGVATGVAILMLAFPYYVRALYSGHNYQNLSIMRNGEIAMRITIPIQGMTCTGCEASIENTIAQMPGVETVKASYERSVITVDFLPNRLQEKQILAAILKTGYDILEDNPDPKAAIDDPGNLSFYKVPLVCNAAPSIGCGSRSKPVLLSFEKSGNVEGAWLNRQGSVIAITWTPGTDSQVRRKVAKDAFTAHEVNAGELLAQDYARNLASFLKKDGWYRGSDVNALSKEEAEIIADRFLQAIKKKTILTSTHEQMLKDKITNSFYHFFVNFKSMDELVDPQNYRDILSGIIEFGDDLLGKNKMPELNELWEVCSGGAKSCNHESCSTTCEYSSN